MGYTNYWSFKKAPRGNAKELEATYQKAILECQKVVYTLAEINRDLFGTSYMSGYSAHCKPGEYGGIKLNGSRGEDCEDFILREHYNQNDTGNFCKTNRNYYDEAVIACLLVLKYRLGDVVTVNSDGDLDEWQPVADRVSEILRRKVTVPDTIHTNNVRQLKKARLSV